MLTTPASAPHTSTIPHILVAEDDPVSLQFFRDTLEQSGYRVSTAKDGSNALEQARKQRFDLLLLDCRMPDFGATVLLSTLRTEPRAASHDTPALAMSAEMDSAQRRDLQDAGFRDVLHKPVSMQTLRQQVASLLPMPAPVAQSGQVLLDDQSALHKSGDATTVQALRKLFTQELDHLLTELDTLAAHPEALSERLHRLLASCGFCGAAALATASRHLKQQVDDHSSPLPSEAVNAFRSVLENTLQALHDNA